MSWASSILRYIKKFLFYAASTIIKQLLKELLIFLGRRVALPIAIIGIFAYTVFDGSLAFLISLVPIVVFGIAKAVARILNAVGVFDRPKIAPHISLLGFFILGVDQGLLDLLELARALRKLSSD